MLRSPRKGRLFVSSCWLLLVALVVLVQPTAKAAEAVDESMEKFEGGDESSFYGGGAVQDCTDLVCDTVVYSGESCSDCNGCDGAHAASWSTTDVDFGSDGNYVEGLVGCMDYGSAREFGFYRCQADSSGASCKDCGSCWWVNEWCP